MISATCGYHVAKGCHAVLGVGVFVPLGQLEQDDFPFLIVDVVE